jgi:hypothetical protein
VNAKMYNILAVIPTTQAAFQVCFQIIVLFSITGCAYQFILFCSLISVTLFVTLK